MRKLVLLTALAMLTATALAATPATPTYVSGGYTYILQENGSAQIVCWDGPETTLAVPGTLDGHTVTSVSECAFADCPNLRRIALPDTVRDIGDQAFVNCVSLTSISLPEGLVYIGTAAFERCEGLTRVALPDTLAGMGDNPFERCANLYQIDVGAANAGFYTLDGVLFSRDDRLVTFPVGMVTDYYAVPEGTTAIGARAFDRDLYLKHVELPRTLTAIGAEAFDGCNGLRSMNLPASVTDIGADAMRCSNLVLTTEDGVGSAQLAQAETGLDGA